LPQNHSCRGMNGKSPRGTDAPRELIVFNLDDGLG
jgi:hypothetical protein